LEIQNQEVIKDILSLDKNDVLSSDQLLDELNWDSIAIVVLQTYIDDEYGEEIDPDSLSNFLTLEDLDSYLSSFK
tara:strand:+ start:210 stop:434 length:225 start_codon:yes stop_codon:yes gene_type:complete